MTDFSLSGIGTAEVDFSQCSPGSDDSQLDLGNDDDNLSGFEYMRKYSKSSVVFRRQEIAKNFVEIFGSQIGSKENEDEVFAVFECLSQDKDTPVKTDIMEQSGRLAELCYTLSDQYPHYTSYIEEFVLKSIYTLLRDDASQVRKASRLTLIYLAEKGILTPERIRIDVVPILEDLLDQKNVDDLRAEAVALMVKFAVLCGKDVATDLFLDKFVKLCRDPVFSIRKTCALSFPDLLRTIGEAATESHLIPEFSSLCSDAIWGVRKVCADCFITFSFYVSDRTRREILTPLFINCLQDQSRWVKMAAFQNLGPFISTFADKAVSGVSLDAEGRLVIHEDILDSLRAASQSVFDSRFASNLFWSNPLPNNVDLDSELIKSNIDAAIDGDVSLSGENADDGNEKNDDAESGYSTPGVTESGRDSTTAATEGSPVPKRNMYSEYESPIQPASGFYNERVADSSCADDVEFDSLHDSSEVDAINSQTAVPPELLLQYVSMVDPKIALNLDPELAKQCAFALPGVAYTLGRENWECLRKTYHTLARDMQWKVRRSLAFSIHELALILGPELVMTDLLQVFDSFLTDLDEVKAGILKHFADFLKLLDPAIRESYLHKLNGFIKPDNVRNWRFRQDLAQQLILLCDLYTSEHVKKFIVPLAISLSSDRVAQVRLHSFKLIAQIITKFYREPTKDFSEHLRNLLLERFGSCNMFFGRLTYVQMCEVAMQQQGIDIPRFCEDYVPKLLALHQDHVVNIRIALSRTLKTVRESRPEFFSTFQGSPSVAQVVQVLSCDSDRDVRYFCDMGQEVVDHPDSSSPSPDHTADSPPCMEEPVVCPPDDGPSEEDDAGSQFQGVTLQLQNCALSEEHSQEGAASAGSADSGNGDSSSA